MHVRQCGLDREQGIGSCFSYCRLAIFILLYGIIDYGFTILRRGIFSSFIYFELLIALLCRFISSFQIARSRSRSLPFRTSCSNFNVKACFNRISSTRFSKNSVSACHASAALNFRFNFSVYLSTFDFDDCRQPRVFERLSNGTDRFGAQKLNSDLDEVPL